MSRLVELHDEFTLLKKELFGESVFVVLDQDDKKVKRYNQLLGFFYPQFKTTGWTSPV
jgi:hypothetical protein